MLKYVNVPRKCTMLKYIFVQNSSGIKFLNDFKKNDQFILHQDA